MVEPSTIRKTVSCVVALMMVVSFTVAPAAALTQDSTIDDTVDDDAIDIDAADSDGSDAEGVEVRIVRTNSPVTTGEQVNVTVDVETNDGGTVELLIDGESVEERGFAPGQDDQVNFTWSTSYSDAGEHNATVVSGADSDNETVEVEAGASLPESRCTDVPGRVNENVPYEDVPYQDDLPEEAPRPIPPFITPRSVGNIVVGVVPNQCEIQDPNDPSVDPTDPPTDPEADVTVARFGEYEDGGVFLVYYRASLNGSDGPGVSGYAGGIAYSTAAKTDHRVAASDGEKEYFVSPRVDGDTSTAEAAVTPGTPFLQVTAEVDCSGGECQPGTEGVPEPGPYPSVPAPIWDGED